MRTPELVTEGQEFIQKMDESLALQNDVSRSVLFLLAQFDQSEPITVVNYSNDVIGYKGEEYLIYCSRSEEREDGLYDVAVGLEMGSFKRTLLITDDLAQVVDRTYMIGHPDTQPIAVLEARGAILDDLRKFQEIAHEMRLYSGID